jgi:hypothetical protein
VRSASQNGDKESVDVLFSSGEERDMREKRCYEVTKAFVGTLRMYFKQRIEN